MNLDPELVLTNKVGMEMGAGTYLEKEIEILGDPIEDFIVPDFNVNREPVKIFRPSSGMNAIKNALVPKPYIIADKCVKCGICVNMCPVTPRLLTGMTVIKKILPHINMRDVFAVIAARNFVLKAQFI